jgi:DNA polymerase III subunit delta
MADTYLVKGTDPLLRDRALAELLTELVGDEDHGLVVEEIVVPGKGERVATDDDADDRSDDRPQAAAAAAAANAAQSPPFLTSGRVVVVRDVGNLTKADAAPLVGYLAAPLETTTLVLVQGGGKTPDVLAKALKEVDVDEVKPETEDTAKLLERALADAGLKLQAGAVKQVGAHLGEDASRVHALVEVLRAAHGPGARLDVADVEPYLGDTGSVPRFRLTAAIESGDVAAALGVLHRLLHATGAQQPKPLHPLQVMASLHGYYRQLLRLDDPDVRNASDAATALDMKEYPARMRLEHVRALGSDGLRQAYAHLAQADLDLKGARSIPEDAVMEVLVARLAALTGRSRGGARRR